MGPTFQSDEIASPRSGEYAFVNWSIGRVELFTEWKRSVRGLEMSIHRMESISDRASDGTPARRSSKF